MTPLMRLEQLSKNCHDAIATLKSEATSTRGVWKRRLLLEQLKLLTTYSDELDAALSAMKEDCAWRLEDGEFYVSACGKVDGFQFNDGGPHENGVRFCFGCGKPLPSPPRTPVETTK
jgi:hypothetical protein